MKALDRDFYLRDTVTVARELLGKIIVRDLDGKRLMGRIKETEAYGGLEDKACHGYGGRRTKRTETLFGPPGTSYVYLIYGVYHCLNFVTEPEGVPCAVLLRAIEAIDGEKTMALARFGRQAEEMTSYQKRNFLNGPGKVCKALSIDRSLNGLDLTVGKGLWVSQDSFTVKGINTSKRIGVGYAKEAAEFPWRFFY